MKKNLLNGLVSLFVLSVLLISCSKENSLEQNLNVVSNKIMYSDTVNNVGTGIITVYYMDTFRVSFPDTTKWHYVAVAFYDNNRSQIYIDGVKKVDSYRDNVPYNYRNVYLGASLYTSFTDFYQGYIDELRISNKIRSENDIKSYYDRCISGDYSQTLDENSIGLWRFDEKSGNTFGNEVLNTNNGVLSGNYSFKQGLSGNAIYFDGLTGMGNCNINIPEYTITIEFWFKSSRPTGTIIQPYGLYSTNISYL